MPRWASPEQVRAAQQGSQAALDALVEAVWPGCYRVAFCALGNPALAEDAAQEACIALYRGVPSLREVAAFDTWLYRIVVREAARVRRQRPRPTPTGDMAVNVDGVAVEVDMRHALAALSPRLREVTVLHYFEDLTSREIAAVLGIPDGTVRFRLMMARRRLRHILDGYDETHALHNAEVPDYAT